LNYWLSVVAGNHVLADSLLRSALDEVTPSSRLPDPAAPGR